MSITTEVPIVVLKVKKSLVYFAAALFILITLFVLFCVLTPVLMSGDIMSVKPSDVYGYEFKLVLFVAGILWIITLPVLILGVSRLGNISFYEDRLAITSFLSLNTRVFYFRNSYVLAKKDFRGANMLISYSAFQPSLICQPWSYFKWIYFESAFILLNDSIENPEMWEQAIDILSKRVLKYTEA